MFICYAPTYQVKLIVYANLCLAINLSLILISHDMVKLCLTKKGAINAVARTKLSTHILRCLIWKRTYCNNKYNFSNDLLTPCSFIRLYLRDVSFFCCLGSWILPCPSQLISCFSPALRWTVTVYNHHLRLSLVNFCHHSEKKKKITNKNKTFRDQSSDPLFCNGCVTLMLMV